MEIHNNESGQKVPHLSKDLYDYLIEQMSGDDMLDIDDSPVTLDSDGARYGFLCGMSYCRKVLKAMLQLQDNPDFQ